MTEHPLAASPQKRPALDRYKHSRKMSDRNYILEDQFEARFLQDAPADVAPAKAVTEWAKRRGLRLKWSRGAHLDTMTAHLMLGQAAPKPHKILTLETSGRVWALFDQTESTIPTEDERDRQQLDDEFRSRFSLLPNASPKATRSGSKVAVRLSDVVAANKFEELLAVLDWLVDTSESHYEEQLARIRRRRH